MWEDLSAREMIQAITSEWFLMEPIMFEVYCKHQLKANDTIKVPIRSGKGLIEYNGDIVKSLKQTELGEYLRTEAIRILLKHPYERRPLGCDRNILVMASDIVVSQHYPTFSIKLTKASDVNLEAGHHYEWYIRELSSQGGKRTAGGKNPHLAEQYDYKKKLQMMDMYAELWEEDGEMKDEINGTIQRTKSWGTMPGDVIEQIKASSEAHIDYKRLLSVFRASVLGSHRRLTRMRPNRRTGFLYMGSTRSLSTKILAAIDVSGSVSSETVGKFLGIIERLFKYNVSVIDVLEFDTEIKDCVHQLKESRRKFSDNGYTIVGRGGTDFQCVIDYLEYHNNYDGLIILTDGYAPNVTVNFYTKAKILWVLEDKKSYDESFEWMSKIGRVCYLEI